MLVGCGLVSPSTRKDSCSSLPGPRAKAVHTWLFACLRPEEESPSSLPSLLPYWLEASPRSRAGVRITLIRHQGAEITNPLRILPTTSRMWFLPAVSLFVEQKQTHRFQKQSRGCLRGNLGGGGAGRLEVTRTLLCGQMTNGSLWYSSGKSTQ